MIVETSEADPRGEDGGQAAGQGQRRRPPRVWQGGAAGAARDGEAPATEGTGRSDRRGGNPSAEGAGRRRRRDVEGKVGKGWRTREVERI